MQRHLDPLADRSTTGPDGAPRLDGDDGSEPGPTIGERVRSWLRPTPAEGVGLAVLVVGSVLATLLWWGQSVTAATGPAEVAGRGGGAAAGSGASEAAPVDAAAVGAAVDALGDTGPAAPGEVSGPGHHGEPVATAPGPVIVHLSGAVVTPGLVELPAGGRVGAAVLAAGGLTAEADTDRINLARPVTDGEHVHVPRRGEDPPVPLPGPLPGPSPAPPAGAHAAVGSAGADAGDGLLDLNRASVAELETLPGIGPSRAAAIVQHREQHGPFRAPGDLREVSGIGEATFQNLAPLVVVR